jgi:hypothetical protein
MAINTILSTKITDTGSEPITTTQAKLHASIDYGDYDSLIPIYISAARIAIERATGLALVEKTVKHTVNLKADVPFAFSYSPVKQFSYAIYEPNQIGPNYWINGELPNSFGANNELLTVEQDGMYEIEYKAGYDVVPNDLKLAILQMFTFIFNHRGEYQEGKLETSLEAQSIILDVRRFSI